MKNILLVEYDQLLADIYWKVLQPPYQINFARDAQSSIDILDSNKIDLIILDPQLGHHNGIELVHEIRSHDDWLSIPIVIMSSLPESEFPYTKQAWERYGVTEFCYKVDTKPQKLKLIADKVFA